MKRSAAAAYFISRTAFACAVFSVFVPFWAVVLQAESADILPLWPFLCIAIVFAAGLLLKRTGMTLLKYTAVQIVLTAAELVFLWFMIKAPSDALRFKAFVLVTFAIDAGICAGAAVSDIKTGSLMHRFDVCILLLVVTLIAGGYSDLPSISSALFMTFAALILLLISVVVLRTETRKTSGNKAGIIIPIIVFVIVLGAAVLLGQVAAGGVQTAVSALASGIKAVGGAIASAAVFLWGRWITFCNWIASYFEPGEEIPLNIEENERPPETVDPQEFSPASVIVLYILTALLIAAVVTAIILYLKKRSVKMRLIGIRDNRAAVRSGGFGASLKDLVQKISDRIRYRYNCIRFRNTPAGLLAWCEARATGKKRRLDSESGPEFLRRLAEAVEGNGRNTGSGDEYSLQLSESRNALSELADLVERSFYSSAAPAADRELCRKIRSIRF